MPKKCKIDYFILRWDVEMSIICIKWSIAGSLLARIIFFNKKKYVEFSLKNYPFSGFIQNCQTTSQKKSCLLLSKLMSSQNLNVRLDIN